MYSPLTQLPSENFPTFCQSAKTKKRMSALWWVEEDERSLMGWANYYLNAAITFLCLSVIAFFNSLCLFWWFSSFCLSEILVCWSVNRVSAVLPQNHNTFGLNIRIVVTSFPNFLIILTIRSREQVKRGTCNFCCTETERVWREWVKWWSCWWKVVSKLSPTFLFDA